MSDGTSAVKRFADCDCECHKGTPMIHVVQCCDGYVANASQVKSRVFVWLVICVSLVCLLSTPVLPGWAIGAILVATLMLCIPLSVQRYRLERNLARWVWRALTTR